MWYYYPVSCPLMSWLAAKRAIQRKWLFRYLPFYSYNEGDVLELLLLERVRSAGYKWSHGLKCYF